MLRRRSLLVTATLIAMMGLPAAFAGLSDYRTAVQSEPSLISYYTFDADTTAVTDTASGGHNGTLVGSGTTFTAAADAVGSEGQALSLNGSGWVTFGSVEEFAFETGDKLTGHTVSGSVEMWIKPGALAGAFGSDPCLAGVRDKKAAGDPTRWSMHLKNNRDGWLVWGGGAGGDAQEFNFVPDQWYHLVFVWNQPSWTRYIYANGVLIGSYWSIGDWDNSWGAPFDIGSSSPTGAEKYIGLIDEVSIYYDHALTGEEVLTHYEAMNGPKFDAPTAASNLLTGYETAVQAEPSLLSFYSFEGDTTAVTDKKGSVPGTLVAPTQWTNGFAGGQALGLAGAGSVTMGAVPAFSFPDRTGTFEAWINPMGHMMGLHHGRKAILSCADDYSHTYAALELDTSSASVGVESTIEGYVGANIPGGLAYADKWYHVAAVLNAGTMDVYVNGKPTLTGATLTLDPYAGFLSNFQIGAVDPSGDWGFPGKIDEVAVYGDALTASQIAAHYAAVSMTLSVHEHEFVNPTNMTPVDVTLSAPTGQTSSGLELTFSYDASIITVTLPAYGLTLAPGVAYPIPDGTSSAVLRVTPVSGGYGTTTLRVTANAASGWVLSDSADFTVLLGDGGLIVVDDDFNDNILGTNTGHPGGGFWRYFNGTTHNEVNSAWTLTNGEYNFSSGGIYSKPAGNFKFMNAQGVRIEWVITNVELTGNGDSGFPGGAAADCRHELGVVSANRNNAADMQDHELFRNSAGGGFYVSVFYSGSSYPTQNYAVTGNIRVVNASHLNGRDDEGAAGLETPVTFQLDNVDTITVDKPLVVTIELSKTGWKVGFSQSADPVYTIAAEHPGVSVDAVDRKVVGGWGTDSLGSGTLGAAINTEFDNGGFLWAMFQNIGWSGGRGWGAIDRVKACVGCELSTDCPNPFADFDRDGDVDMLDFAQLQQCYTGTTIEVSNACHCLDKDGNGHVDDADVEAFVACGSGAQVPADRTCDDQ